MNRINEMFTIEFVRVPRPLNRLFGCETALVLSELFSEYEYWKSQNKLGKGGWFFSTVENMKYMTGLSKHKQSKSCKELEEYGIIQMRYYGMPPKRYFRFNLEGIEKLQKDFEEYRNKKSRDELSFGGEPEIDLEEDFEPQDSTKYEYPTRKFEGFSF